MPAKKHPVILTADEQATLQKVARSNKRSSLERRRARILLASAEGQGDTAVARAVGVHVNTVINTRTRFAARGTQSVRRAEQKRRKARVLDGQARGAPRCLGVRGATGGTQSLDDEPARWSAHGSARGGRRHGGDRAPDA